MPLQPSNEPLGFAHSQPEESAGFLLWQVTMQWQRRMNQVLAPLKLTHAQFVVLAAVGWLSAGATLVTQVEVAKHARLDSMFTSKLIRALLAHGWLHRQAHPRDSRAKVLGVTPAGAELLQQALQVVNAADDAFFGQLGTMELQAELRQLLQELAG